MCEVAKLSDSNTVGLHHLVLLPDSVDWREKGAISKVKNQGGCGSCWAFATTEMIESYAQISSQEMVELSTQQVTSCTPNPTSCGGVGGCKGSIAQLGYNYIQLFGPLSPPSLHCVVILPPPHTSFVLYFH